jgi:hypothetical protein
MFVFRRYVCFTICLFISPDLDGNRGKTHFRHKGMAKFSAEAGSSAFPRFPRRSLRTLRCVFGDHKSRDPRDGDLDVIAQSGGADAEVARESLNVCPRCDDLSHSTLAMAAASLDHQSQSRIKGKMENHCRSVGSLRQLTCGSFAGCRRRAITGEAVAGVQGR